MVGLTFINEGVCFIFNLSRLWLIYWWSLDVWFTIPHSYFWTESLFLSLCISSSQTLNLSHIALIMKSTKWCRDTASCTAARSIWPPPPFPSLPPTHTALTGSCISSSAGEHGHSCRSTPGGTVSFFTGCHTEPREEDLPENAKSGVTFTHGTETWSKHVRAKLGAN